MTAVLDLSADTDGLMARAWEILLRRNPLTHEMEAA